ncbi:MAG TPA: hypothetical protein VIK52_10240, partial [Opitutaceae bacterium]
SLLLLVLWLLYLPECLLWVNRHSVVFTSPWSRGWSATTASDALGSGSASLRLLNPLPPLGRFFKADLLPVSISPVRVASFNAQTISPAGRPKQAGGTIAIDEIHRVSVHDSEILINGHSFAKVGSRALRTSFAALLDELRARPEAGREKLIERFWQSQFDLEQARAALAEAGRRSATLAAACNAQFLLIYIVLPVLSVLKGLNYVIIPGAIVMEVMAIQIAVIHFLAHRCLFPRSTTDRVTQVVKMILCAPLGIRAVDALTTPVAGRFHILTIAAALDPFPGKTDFLGRVLRDLRHPIGLGSMNELLAETCRWQNAMIERVAARALPDVGALVPTLGAPPPRLEPGCRCHCPRCHAQLLIAAETCPDCLGVRMIPVAAAETQPAEATTHGR